MNEKIQKMYEQSFGDGTAGFYGFDKNKFAELIINQCVELVNTNCKNIGSESNNFVVGYLRCGEDSINSMKSIIKVGNQNQNVKTTVTNKEEKIKEKVITSDWFGKQHYL